MRTAHFLECLRLPPSHRLLSPSLLCTHISRLPSTTTPQALAPLNLCRTKAPVLAGGSATRDLHHTAGTSRSTAERLARRTWRQTSHACCLAEATTGPAGGREARRDLSSPLRDSMRVKFDATCGEHVVRQLIETCQPCDEDHELRCRPPTQGPTCNCEPSPS